MSRQVVQVFASITRARINEAALVLTAVGIDNMIHHHEHRWVLLVPEEDEHLAHHQLQTYWHENKPNPERPVAAEMVDSGWPGVVGYLFVIWMIPALGSFSQLDFLTQGRLHADAVMDGQWWRAATALTLHADIAHIAANSFFGCVFGLFVGRYLGSGLGWLLVLLSGIGANLLNALVQPEQFKAIGASTATFAALGIVPAYGWRKGFFRGRGFTRGFAPIFGAICILAFTGFGSERVDVLGHIFGFAAGIGMGLIAARAPRLDPHRMSTSDQQRAGAAALILLAAAWCFALLSPAIP